MNRDELLEATMNKIIESKYENEEFENELDNIWNSIKTHLESLDMTFKPKGECNQYKEWGIYTTEPIQISEGVQRRVEVNCFYGLPSFPTYYYYIGAEIEVVEESTNKTNVGNLTSDGYTVKNEIKGSRISVSTATDKLVNKADSVEDFAKAVENTIHNLKEIKIVKF